MIQCDSCNVWQHGPCVGIWGDDEAPDGQSGRCRMVHMAEIPQSIFAKNADRTSMAH